MRLADKRGEFGFARGPFLLGRGPFYMAYECFCFYLIFILGQQRGVGS